eukprot:2908561-Amphidinium_carterae.1
MTLLDLNISCCVGEPQGYEGNLDRDKCTPTRAQTHEHEDLVVNWGWSFWDHDLKGVAPEALGSYPLDLNALRSPLC